MQAWPFGVHHFHQGLDNHRVESPQWRVFTHEQVGFSPQRVQHAGDFYCDITSTHHRNAFWHGVQIEETV
ncbi:hypothetical protein D3C77_795050 [compost metagenome]